MDRVESLECPFAGLAFTELRHSLLGRVLVLTGAHSFTRMNRVAAAASWMMVAPLFRFHRRRRYSTWFWGHENHRDAFL